MLNNDPLINNKINPNDITEYNAKLKTHYKEDKHHVQKIFTEALKDVSQTECCIFLTGSHGRKEKLGSSSKYELIVVFKKGINHQERIFLQKKIQEIVRANENDFDTVVEYKELGKDSSINYREENNVSEKENISESDNHAQIPPAKQKLIPTRVFDSMKVWGDNSIKKDYYSAIHPELQSLNANAYKKFAIDFRKSTIVQLNKTVENKNTPQMHFDAINGKMLYDGNRSKASKFPFLRTIQYQLAHLIFSQVRGKKMTEKQLNELRKLRTLNDRLTWMVNNQFIKLSPEKLKAIADAYTISLIWYETAEKNFREKGTTEMAVDLAQLKQQIAVISEFAKIEK